jgi:spore maturation protein CgeB
MMRIAVVGPISSDSFAKCIFQTLQDMGHDVLSVNPDKSFLSGFLPDSLYTRHFLYLKVIEDFFAKSFAPVEAYQWKKPAEAIRRYEPDLILSTVWDIPPGILEKLKRGQRRDPLAVMWCPDALINFGRQYLFLAPWDFLFFKDKYLVDIFKKKLELNAHFLPLACYPKWHRQLSLSAQELKTYGCDITIAGGLYPYRAKIFEHFLSYQIKIWGQPLSSYLKSPVRKFHQGRYVGELEKSKAFNGAAIVLNTMHYSEISGLNQRVFDACGCGAFQVVDDSPSLKDFFIPGKELVCFQDLKELKEIIPYYLNRPQERAEIARSGYLRAHAEHTFQHRLNTMFQLINRK